MAEQSPRFNEEDGAFVSTLARLLAGGARGAYLVGGCLRDLLLERPLHDVDIAVAGDAITLGRQLADALHGHFVPLDPQRGVVRIVVPESEGPARYVDLVAFGGDIATDLARRDFTIDAMAAPLAAVASSLEEAIIDHCGCKLNDWVRAHGKPAMLTELLDLVSTSLGLTFAEIHGDADL
ncbi:MAG: hypothetical protein ACE5IZ_00295, partial [Dehalococcoidia bacterium]